MTVCSVKGCKNRYEKTRNTDIKYFRFPKDPKILKEWIKFCKNEKLNLKYARMCSIHFTENCFEKKPEHLIVPGDTNIYTLSKEAVPTLNLRIDCDDSSNKQKVLSDLNEGCTSEKKRLKIDTIHSFPITFASNDTSSHKENYLLTEEVQKIHQCNTSQEIDNEKYQDINQRLRNLECENEQLKIEKLHFKEKNECLQEVNNMARLANKVLRMENKKLKINVKNLSTRIRLLEKIDQQNINNKVYKILKPVFTNGQISKLLHPRRRVKWSSEDISSAIALRTVSPKTYRYLKKNNMPLPALSTLRNRAATINLKPGVLDPVLSALKGREKTMADYEKICVLCYDEIYISQHVEIDKKEEKRIGPHRTVQLGMIRGLFKKWKQPIYYNFDQPLTTEIINETIGKLFDVGFIVVALTTDLDSTNSKLWNLFNIGITSDKKCYFVHPRNENLKVYVFVDVPHLLKLIRNNFLDSGFYLENIFLNKNCLEELLLLNSNDLKISYKLEQKYLDVTGTERQKVSWAARVFSNNTSEAIRWCGVNGFLTSEHWNELADFIKLVNDWFDLFNSKIKYSKSIESSAYGTNLEKQNNLLDRMTSYIENMRVRGHRNLIPFQKGIILNNKSLKELFSYLKDHCCTNKFSIEYMFTNRLNQDVIENFFS